MSKKAHLWWEGVGIALIVVGVVLLVVAVERTSWTGLSFACLVILSGVTCCGHASLLHKLWVLSAPARQSLKRDQDIRELCKRVRRFRGSLLCLLERRRQALTLQALQRGGWDEALAAPTSSDEVSH